MLIKYGRADREDIQDQHFLQKNINNMRAPRGVSLTLIARTPPDVNPGMTIWGVKGRSHPIFFGLNLIFLVT